MHIIDKLARQVDIMDQNAATFIEIAKFFHNKMVSKEEGWDNPENVAVYEAIIAMLPVVVAAQYAFPQLMKLNDMVRNIRESSASSDCIEANVDDGDLPVQ